jgi:hypothetical protein
MTLNVMEATDQSPGLDFSFGSFVFQDAFKKPATSLRWMFWGTVLQLAGFASLAAPVAALMIPEAAIAQRIGRPQIALLLPGGLMLATLGGIVVILGEQKCLHLQLPLGMTRSLPGHHWLRGAYWFHLGSWLLRLARNFLGRGPVSLILIPMQLIGFGLLLMFLRKMADCLARPDLRRRVDLILGIGGCTLLIGAFLVFDQKLKLNLCRRFLSPPPLHYWQLR